MSLVLSIAHLGTSAGQNNFVMKVLADGSFATESLDMIVVASFVPTTLFLNIDLSQLFIPVRVLTLISIGALPIDGVMFTEDGFVFSVKVLLLLLFALGKIFGIDIHGVRVF